MALGKPASTLILYGKSTVSPFRKMGHITMVGRRPRRGRRAGEGGARVGAGRGGALEFWWVAHTASRKRASMACRLRSCFDMLGSRSSAGDSRSSKLIWNMAQNEVLKRFLTYCRVTRRLSGAASFKSSRVHRWT